MEILLFDRSEKQIGRLLPELVSPTEIEDLSGEHRLLFSYPSDADWAESIAEGHLVACQDMDRAWQLYEIVQVRDQIGTVEAICEHAYYSLSGMEFVNATCEGSALTALTTVLASTGWEPGTVEIQTARTCLFEHMNPLAAITKIAEHWGGELRFRVEISGASIVGKYVDLLTRRGDVTGKRFEFGRDIRDIDITLNRSAVVTALYGWGQGESIPEDGEETERLTFADVEWVKGEEAELHPGGLTSPAPADKPLGQLWVGDEEARLAHGRYNPATGKYDHIFGEYESQAQSPQALIWETWRQLQKRCEPLVNIKATVASLEQIPGFEHEKVRLGDTCYVILPDFKKQPLTFGLGLKDTASLSLSPAALSLDPDGFSMQVNERIISFRGDETAVVEDEWLAKGNRNLIPGSHLGGLGAIQTGAGDSPVETQGMDAPLSLYWNTRLEDFLNDR